LSQPSASFFLIFAFTGRGFPQPSFGLTDVLAVQLGDRLGPVRAQGLGFSGPLRPQDRHPS